MTVILCVWFGEEYGPEYLDWIRERFSAAVTRHELHFAVLTDRNDVPEEWEAIPFISAFPSKLKKLEMFRPDLFPSERIAYTDLDNTVVSNLDDVLDYSGPLGIRSEFDGMHGAEAKVQSSFVLFEGGALEYLWDVALSYDRIEAQYPIGGGRGDQLFIDHHKREWDDLEALYPGAFVSYRWGWQNGRDAMGYPINRGAAKVIFHHGPWNKPHIIGWLKPAGV